MENISINNPAKEYRIERLDANRLYDLGVLHKAVYGVDQPHEFWQKKYDTTYTGVSYIGYIAYNKSNIAVANYSVMPCFFKVAEEIILVAQSGDTMTHPQFRYKGMFIELATMTYELCRANGINLVFGFPNQNSISGFVNKLGIIVIENLDRFTIPVKTFPLESLLRKSKWTARLYAKYVKRVLHKYYSAEAGLPDQLIKEGFDGILRDSRYLTYKTYSKSQVIKIGQASIWIKIKNGLIIGDLEIAGEDFDAIMYTIIKIAGRLGVSQVTFQTSPGTHIHSLFAGKYSAVSSLPVAIKDLGAGIPFGNLKFTFADIDVF